MAREVKRPGVRGGRWYRTRTGKIRYGLQFGLVDPPDAPQDPFVAESMRLRRKPFKPFRATIRSLQQGRYFRISPVPGDPAAEAEKALWEEMREAERRLKRIRPNRRVEVNLYPHRRDMEADPDSTRGHEVIVTARAGLELRRMSYPYVLYRFRHAPDCAMCARNKAVRAAAGEKAQSLLLADPIHKAVYALGWAAAQKWARRWDASEAIRRGLVEPKDLSWDLEHRYIIPFPDYVPPYPPRQGEQWPDWAFEDAIKQYREVPEPEVLRALLERVEFATRCVEQANAQAEAAWRDYLRQHPTGRVSPQEVDHVFETRIRESMDPLMREAERLMSEYNEICKSRGLYRP
jgi:hypothetical protein